jgi:excisionase family DNA binding protein
MPRERLMSVREAADLLSVDPSTIYRYIRDGELAAVRVGTGAHAPIRIPAASLLRHLHPTAVPSEGVR